MKITETHIVPAGVANIRLQEYAVSIFTHTPTRSAVKKAIKRGQILLEGEPGQTGDWIEPGQTLQFCEPEITKKIFKLDLKVVFEDDFLAVVFKPEGIPSSGNYFRSLENALAYNLKSTSAEDALPFPQVVHRLDKPTSGLVIAAKTGAALRGLNSAFEAKEIEKTYFALVEGIISNRQIINRTLEGKISETGLKPLLNFVENSGFLSLLELNPKTGRTHQLRKHLSGLGHPILGDLEYGSRQFDYEKKPGIFLTASALKFHHPITSEVINLSAGLPRKFRKFKALSHLA
ncbi:RluA family pseudouridine synthase [Salegentibacter sp. HM20]